MCYLKSNVDQDYVEPGIDVSSTKVQIYCRLKSRLIKFINLLTSCGIDKPETAADLG